jgi:DNA-binding MarR family transcriptional regulator
MMSIPLQQGYNLIKATYLLLDDGDRAFLKTFGVTPVQFYTLLWLDAIPRKALSQLSRDLLCDPANVTRLVDRMEEKGLLTRQRDQQDRRIIWVALTAEGQTLCEQLRHAHRQYTQERMSVLTEDEQTALNTLLGKLCNGLGNHLQAAST